MKDTKKVKYNHAIDSDSEKRRAPQLYDVRVKNWGLYGLKETHASGRNRTGYE